MFNMGRVKQKSYFLFNASDSSHCFKRILSSEVNVSCDATKCNAKGATIEAFLAKV